jgi:hypothetical protein
MEVIVARSEELRARVRAVELFSLTSLLLLSAIAERGRWAEVMFRFISLTGEREKGKKER